MEIVLGEVDLGSSGGAPTNTPRAFMTTTNSAITATLLNTPIKIANTTALDPDPQITNLISMPSDNRLDNDSGSDFRAIVSIDSAATKGSGSAAQNLEICIYLDGSPVQEAALMHASSVNFVQQSGMTRQFVWPAASFIEIFVTALTDNDSTIFNSVNVTVTFDGKV